MGDGHIREEWASLRSHGEQGAGVVGHGSGEHTGRPSGLMAMASNPRLSTVGSSEGF